MDVSIIIINWNTKDLLIGCLSSIFDTVKDLTFEIWLVDNASIDGSVETVERIYEDVKIIQNKENIGFSAANNQAFHRMQGRYALLLNTDTILTQGAVEMIYEFMENNPKVGMACGQLLNRDGSKQNSIASFPNLISLLCNESLLQILSPKKYPSKRKEHSEPIEVDSCIGACLMVRKDTMEDVGLFDESYFFFFEETDWAYRMKQAGWKIYFIPSAQIYHFQGQSVGHHARSRILYYRSRYIYFQKWHRGSYNLIRWAVFFRLLINACLNFLAVVGTFGVQTSLKRKLSVYSQLIRWHLRGCPDER